MPDMNEGAMGMRIAMKGKVGRPRQERVALAEQAGYDPANLLGALIAKLNLKTDAALAHALGVGAPVISKIRHRVLPVGPSLLIRMHELSGIGIRELRSLMQPDRDASESRENSERN